MSNNIIYIVTCGSYSDYGIECIFSTKEKAEKWIEEKNKDKNDYSYGDYNIEEWKLNEQADFISKERHNLKIDLDTGEIFDYFSNLVVVDPNLRVPDIDYQPFHCYNRKLVLCICSYVSKEHAEKLAIEKRQEYLRFAGISNG